MINLCKKTRPFALGAIAAASVVGGALAWTPAEEDCGCELAPGRTSESLRGPSGDWCLTQQLFDARKARGGITLQAVCPPEGPPDDPATRDAAIPNETTPIRTYRLSIHVFRETGGANPAASPTDVANMVARLNETYGPWKVQFAYEWRYVDSTKYRYMDTDEEWAMKRAHAISPTTKLNIFVVTQNQGFSWGTFPWDPQSLTFMGGIVVNQSGFLNDTMSHEVGHCLGLWHTFHGVAEVAECSDCYEPAGRSAEVGDSTGDKCSDTNPTPRMFACTDPANPDPCSGNPWLDVPKSNFMGYSGCPPQNFTPQQAGRIHAWTTHSLTGWLVQPAPPTAPTGLSLAKPGGGVVRATWGDNSVDEDGFELQREKKSGSTWIGTQIVATTAPNATTADDTPGTGTFRYRVRGFNENGTSNWTSWVQVKF